MYCKLTVIANVETLKHANAMNARFKHVRTLLTQLVSIKIQVETSCRLVAGKTKQKML